MAGFDKHNIRFKFQIVDENDDDVLWDESTYILVNDETFECSIDSVETHVYSALRHLPKELARKAREEAEAAEEARREEEELAAEEAAGTIAPAPRFESVTDIRSKIADILKEGDDWYERRRELNCGDVFRCHDGEIVKLDHPKPGDGTKWVVQSWYNGSWFNDESTIEPGDLDEKIADPKKA